MRVDAFRIVLDANEKLGFNLHGLAYLMKEWNLIDLFHQHHGTCPAFFQHTMMGETVLITQLVARPCYHMYKSVAIFLFIQVYLLIIEV